MPAARQLRDSTLTGSFAAASASTRNQQFGCPRSSEAGRLAETGSSSTSRTMTALFGPDEISQIAYGARIVRRPSVTPQVGSAAPSPK